MFCIRLKELREAKGLSQYAFAQKIGVAQSTVGNWESGAREPRMDMIQRIAKYFDVTLSYLIGVEGEEDKPVVSKDDELTEYLEELKNRPDLRMLFSVSKNATKEDVMRTVAIIEALKKEEEGQ